MFASMKVLTSARDYKLGPILRYFIYNPYFHSNIINSKITFCLSITLSRPKCCTDFNENQHRDTLIFGEGHRLIVNAMSTIHGTEPQDHLALFIYQFNT